MNTIIQNVTILNEGKLFEGAVWIENNIIKKVYEGSAANYPESATVIDGNKMLLMPGVIDDQVHFREPGLTYKADIYTESRAAAAGGVTSFMDMPNTNPPVLNSDILEQKFAIAEKQALINYSFYMGASNENIAEIKNVDPKTICGVKVFMGSSTGNMLVDNENSLSAIFAESPVIVAVHCEDENIIKYNTEYCKQMYGENIAADYHPIIRTTEACYKSSSHAVELAAKYGTRLHVLHLSTAKETTLFESTKEKEYIPKITAEVCVHHLWFCDNDYDTLGNKIKCNPAIKLQNDRDALRNAVKNGKIAVVATDHAPHTLAEKQLKYLAAPSGIPLIQHSLVAMLEMYHKGIFSLNDIVERMCHYPAKLFNINKRGFIREGYYADLVLINLNDKNIVSNNDILYKCKWSPFEGYCFSSKIEKTWVNGAIVFDKGSIIEANSAKRLEFDR